MVMTCIYMHIFVCLVVSISRHSGFYAQPRARTHRFDWSVRFSRHGFGHSWGGLLWHISTSLAITEWGFSGAFIIDSWPQRTSEAFWGRKEFGMECRDTQLTNEESLRYCVSSLCLEMTSQHNLARAWDDGTVPFNCDLFHPLNKSLLNCNFFLI